MLMMARWTLKPFIAAGIRTDQRSVIKSGALSCLPMSFVRICALNCNDSIGENCNNSYLVRPRHRRLFAAS
jgi:hypothetical protein